MSDKRILIICYSQHNKEPRLLMQCKALKKNYKITTAGFSPVNDPEINFIQLYDKKYKAVFTFHLKFHPVLRAPFSLINKIHSFFKKDDTKFSPDDFKSLKQQKYDLIICHHPHSLAMAFKLKAIYNSKLIFNAHEIYPLEFENDAEWMKNNFESIDNVLKKYLSSCDYIFTVNKEICDFYEKRYSCKCLPVHNSKPFYDIEVTELKTPIQIIHHGGAMPQRKLEQMAEAVLGCNGKFELTFMLVETNKDYLNELKQKYKPLGINFLSAVSYQDIIPSINKYDIGLYILPNDTINHELALPNKVFEFLQAKLAIITSPNAALKNFVVDNGLGFVATGFDTQDMKNLLNSLTREQLVGFKKRAKEVSGILSSEHDEDKILNTVNTIIN